MRNRRALERDRERLSLPGFYTRVRGGLRTAPQNMLLWSEDFTNAAWVKTGTPDATAHTVTDNDTGTTDELVNQPVTVVASQVYTYTAWVLKDNDETRFPGLRVQSTNNSILHVNTKTGATAFSLNTLSGTVAVANDGPYWRVSITYTAVNTTTTHYVYGAIGTVLGTTSAAAVGTVTVDKTQLNRGSIPAPYITTTTSAI